MAVLPWTADATNITADGRYAPGVVLNIPGPQWTADGGVAPNFTGPMPDFRGLTYYQACAACYLNTWVPLPPVYIASAPSLEGYVIAQAPDVGLTITTNSALTFTVARNPNPYFIVQTQDLTV
jgi:hypothetical protein